MWYIWKKSLLVAIISCCWSSINAQQATISERVVHPMPSEQNELSIDIERAARAQSWPFKAELGELSDDLWQGTCHPIPERRSSSVCGGVLQCTVYIARAFCRDNQGGNLAGVVLEQEFTTEQMQAIAKKLNFSETVFLSKIGPTLYKALYFTPNSSIDFCGHATIAAFGVLKQINHLKNENYQVETPAGLCEVTLSDSLIFLSQSLPVYGQVISEEEIAPVLGISVRDIQLTNLEPQIVSTGLRDIFVPVVTQDCLFSLNPDHELITKLTEKYDAIGLHVFSLEVCGEATTAFCRNFAPRYGIPEESATGSSNGALGCYLSQQGILMPNNTHMLLFKQGDILNAPSNIYVQLISKNEFIEKVECGGEVIIDEIKTFHRNLDTP